VLRRIVAAGLMTAGFLGASGIAEARPTIYVVPSSGIFTRIEGQTAFGLYVPGTGGTVSRARAIAALRRGTVERDFGKPGGKILVDLAFRVPAPPPQPAVYVSLPPPGEQPNTKRYSVAIVGAGYHGILTSDSTRVRGLVSIADIAPTAVALQESRSPPIRFEPDRDARAHLRALDTRLTRVHHDRGWVVVTVVLTIIALAVFAPRAAGIGGAAAMTASLLLSWAGATRFALVMAVMAVLTIALAVAGSFRRRMVPIVVAAFLTAFTIVLAVDPELNSLAVLGARPDGGGRFYGVGNQVETLLLPPVLVAAAIGGRRWLLALAALALVAIGWSKAGADGGGVLVFATALGVLGLRLRGLTLTPRRLALVGVAVLVVALAFVGLDAVLGGSSHVTRAVGSGPDSLLGSLGHRLHLSWLSATDHWYRILIFLSCLAAIVLMGTMRPRRATVDALLAGLAVSLLVNDTPVDVIGLGALGCLVLVRWESVDSRPMRLRAFTTAAALAVLTLALAGCGDEGTARPVADTVVGTVKAEAPGKAIFLSQGCGSCHTFKPAGSDASGTIGPDLDKLPEYTKAANQPLATFVHESIVDPDKYVEKGFPKGVMPKSYEDLPATDLTALVDFLTKPQG
jgi:mono/diheme cytochrome c family protein